ncbi:HypC/HybG/HupF family hydrogenase formation chaperone [Natrinema salifodinae]|uniref:Hydrogenase expression/formation protein HypC n=1 Tax=Natrinema salifodinae TaxID=1202768 RepID=A0A1I0P5S4_9EURY|nr:HypC/HybG/HupF family hydrogenase formation chaperone [Natrinema salifodinae]SEW08868.1 hydrogenase expression/formation protein HypC [Natrinema salifodinae]
MCLGVPGEVKSVDGLRAIVDFWGVQKEVRLDTVDAPVEPGDHILNHVGFAIRRIPDDEIDETMALYESFMDGDPDDMLHEDVADELEAGGTVPPNAVDGTLAAGTAETTGTADDAEPADADDAEDLLEELDIDV